MNNGSIVNNGISELGNFQGIENNGSIENFGSFENFGTLSGSGSFSGNALTIDAGIFEPNGFTVDTDFNLNEGTLRLPNISAGTRLTVTGDAELSGGNIDLVDPFGSFSSLAFGTFTLIDVAEHGELNIASDILQEAISEVNGADTDSKDFELSQIGNDLILTVEDINNNLDSEIDGSSSDDNLEGINADKFMTGDNDQDLLSGADNEVVDYLNLNFNRFFGAVLSSIGVDFDRNRGQDWSSNNKLSPTDRMTIIKNVINTKHNDPMTVFASLNGEEYGVTADVAEYEDSQSDFSFTRSADNFTRSGVFEAIDTSSDLKLSFDNGVIAAEDLFA